MFATCCSAADTDVVPPLLAGFDLVMLERALAKIRKLRGKLPAGWKPTARFLAMMRPLIHAFVLQEWDSHEQRYQKGKPGRPPIPVETKMLLMLLAHRGDIGSDIEACKKVGEHKDWMKALKLERVPDHSTLSKFRKEAGKAFFTAFFAFSIKVLQAIGALDADDAVIADSAPVEARVNFARANRRIELDEAKVVDFLSKIALERADELYPRKNTRGFKASSIVGMLLLYTLGGFLSRSQVFRAVDRSSAVKVALGLKDKVPSWSSITYFIKHHSGDEEALLKPFIDAIVRYFDESTDVGEARDVNIDTFFGWLSTTRALPDPDARIGYNVAKDRAYIGYKCHVLCGNSSHAIYGNCISPANTGDGKYFMPLMEEAERRGLLEKIRKAFGDCAYHNEANLTWLFSRRIDCRFHDKDESGVNRTKRRSARRKSRVRSVIEAIFGIAKNNLTFEKPLVRGSTAVEMDTNIVFAAWNMFMCFACLEGKWMYRVSVKKLF
nr:transposase [Candidatus Sigynarchaeota archaeon]